MNKVNEDSRSNFSQILGNDIRELGSLLKQINLDTPNQIIEEEEESALFSPIHLGEIDHIEETYCT